ncbi:cell envelope integrity EipB family protein [Oceanibaculum pacificum]|uniref:cell envelope integrity EipB family protein n=1 Tax=Oceanibaculum pacificum TaxID=580166 RepID=UPI0018DD03E5|nr:cell envelope integrity EipB family protein [Oceanibaculum pacificum]
MRGRYGVRRAVGCVLVLATLSSPALAFDIAPHRAVYKMSLGKTASNSEVVAAEGAMLMEWGDSCEGWTVEQRYRLRMLYNQGGESDMAVTFVTYEAKDGSTYRFFVERARPTGDTESVSGRAEHAGGNDGLATFTQPQAEKIELPKNVMFPTEHTLAILKAAEAGKRFLGARVFDGNEVEGAMEVTAAIGALIPAATDEKTPALLRRPSWPIRLAFFGKDAKASGQPDYELGLRLFDNGVATELKLDYGDFVIEANLDQIESMKSPGC